MVQPYAGDHGDFRRYDIGAVQPAAKADFDDGDIDLFLGEPPESHSSRNLEERQVQALKVFFLLRDEVPYVLLADQVNGPVRAPVENAHPLAEVQDMRGSVQADLQARGRKGGRHHIGYRPLAVGAGNVHCPERGGRTSEQGVEFLHMLQSGLVCFAESRLLDGRETHEQFFKFMLIFFSVHIEFLQLNPNLVIFTE